MLATQNSLPIPNVVKVDVEGDEYEVLSGLKKTPTSSNCRLVYCELHSIEERGFGGDKASVKALLEEFGFEVETIHTREGDGWEQPFLKAEMI